MEDEDDTDDRERVAGSRQAPAKSPEHQSRIYFPKCRATDDKHEIVDAFIVLLDTTVGAVIRIHATSTT